MKKTAKPAKDKLKGAVSLMKLAKMFQGGNSPVKTIEKKKEILTVKKIEVVETLEAEKQEYLNICEILGIDENQETQEIISIIKRVSIIVIFLHNNSIFCALTHFLLILNLS